jgi:hypothetical protein
MYLLEQDMQSEVESNLCDLKISSRFSVFPQRDELTELATSLPVGVTCICSVNSVSEGIAPDFIVFDVTT